MSERLSSDIARLAGKLGEFLSAALPHAEAAIAQNIAFLRAAAESRVDCQAAHDGPEPISRLTTKLNLSDEEIQLLLLAGMPEEHEGYSAVFRTLHPRAEPRPTVGLAIQLFAGGSRDSFLQWFSSANVIRNGVVRIAGDVPFFEKSLEPIESLWPALHGCDVWPASLVRDESRPALHGLEEWLATDAGRAVDALRQEQACTVLVTADCEETAFHRGLALVAAAGRRPVGFPILGTIEADKLHALKIHALARGVVPVLQVPVSDGPGTPEAPSFDSYPDVVLICGRNGAVSVRGLRPLIALVVDRLGPESRRRMWSRTLPSLSGSAAFLASRYPIEPTAAAEIAADLACLESVEHRAPALADVAAAIRARGAMSLGAGVKLIRPSATWQHLVLPRDREEQLRAALSRLDHQGRVLDEWGFLKGRPGARGVRMLFSGPPGTGKTLSAEVMAGALNLDLLFVDISRVVSKWIGETEKNLAAVFDAAERAQAVLFFDEADALFGRRTEVSDAHDRYANLETAYLLARLERFEGLSILATNLRQNIDPAFLRRLEFVIDFDEPDREARFRLWRCHVPDEKLLNEDVNLYEFAALYAVVGAFIRNAAVAAAFLAAADGEKISRHHFIRAIHREYEKSGKAFPGMPPDLRNKN